MKRNDPWFFFILGMMITLSTVLSSVAADSTARSLAETAPSPSSAAAASGDTLVVTALLREIPGKFAANDLYDYVFIMKYRVLTVEKGAVAGKEILVGHYNPLIARPLVKDKMDPVVDGTVERFVVGAKHRLTCISPIDRVWDGEIEDYYDDGPQKFFALKADLLP